ncbi:Bgt-51753 [Blumeria graminis f. sp. tritici]|uniref:Bgt-51753 n=1 Tax=Blumeria graminis f. sp. tritici TaxID=62690 RepID=A0A9X9QGK2_BLUGR|nr:Bgt-51753 [Blumeria graminis f. sp. tritici]
MPARCQAVVTVDGGPIRY